MDRRLRITLGGEVTKIAFFSLKWMISCNNPLTTIYLPGSRMKQIRAYHITNQLLSNTTMHLFFMKNKIRTFKPVIFQWTVKYTPYRLTRVMLIFTIRCFSKSFSKNSHPLNEWIPKIQRLKFTEKWCWEVYQWDLNYLV